MEFDTDIAIAILNEAKAGGYLEQPIPELPSQAIELAMYYYDEAKRAFESGIRDNTVQTIIWIGDTRKEVGSDPQETVDIDNNPPAVISAPAKEQEEFEVDHQVEPIIRVIPMEREENLPIPAHIEGDATEMPRDFTSVSDKQIRKLSGEYNAFLARTTYLLGCELSDLMNAEHLLEAARAKALREIDTEKKLAKVIDAEILADEEVAEWTKRVKEHEQRVTVLKALKEIYSGNVERLSREWTMRQNEWEKSR
jgi:hypothetical protein